MKFGGTSVGSPERMKGVASLITKSGEPTFVVLSAMSGTTNSLVEISDYLYKKNPDGANEVINTLEKKYLQHIEELYSTEEMRNKTREFLAKEFQYLRSFTKDIFTSFEEKIIVAQGEVMSTNMVVNYLKEQGVKAILLDAGSVLLESVFRAFPAAQAVNLLSGHHRSDADPVVAVQAVVHIDAVAVEMEVKDTGQVHFQLFVQTCCKL